MRSLDRLFLPAALLVALTPCALLAQTATQPSAPGQALTLDEIVAMNLKARGGVDLLRATESMKMAGTVTSPVGQAKLTIWVKRPDRKRTETEFGGQKTIEAFDGTTAWVMMGSMPPQVIPASPQLEQAKKQSDIDPALLDYRERGRTVALVGREKAEGVEVYHLRITDRGNVTHYYVDASTGLDRKMTNRVVHPEGLGAAQVELRFSDYREVQGRKVPFTIQQIVDGKSVAQTRVESVEFNLPIDEAMFKMPGMAPRLP